MGMNPRLLRPLATEFDPRRIAGLELWLDFNDTSKVTASGSPLTISAVADKSGNGWVAEQTTPANRPELQANVIKGRSAGKFNGSSQRLTIASFPAITDLVVFAVIGNNSATARAVFGAQSYSGTAGHVFVGPMPSPFNDWQTGDWLFFGNGFNSGRAPRSIGPLGSITANQIHIITGALTTTRSGLWLNGTEFGTRVNTTGTGTSALGTLSIGSQFDATGFWNGNICELLLYRASVSITQQRAIERWLGGRYGITMA